MNGLSPAELLRSLYIFLTAAALSACATPLVKKLAFRLNAVDQPSARRINTVPMPRMGGLAIYIGFVAATLIFTSPSEQMTGILLGSVVIVILGVFDDIYSLKPLLKLFFQFLAALIPIAFGLRIDQLNDFLSLTNREYLRLGLFAIPITAIWIVALINAVNWIDGLDGLACGVCTISSVSIFIILVQLGDPVMAFTIAALAGACLGFLPFNFNPAKIFMGDTGSMFLGYILATVSIAGMFKWYTVVTFAIPFLVLGFPIFELLFSSIRRLCHGQSPFHADKGHIHHRLIGMGMNQKQAVAILYTVTSLLCLLAVILTTSDIIKILISLAVAVFAAAWAIRLRPIRHQNHTDNENDRDVK